MPGVVIRTSEVEASLVYRVEFQYSKGYVEKPCYKQTNKLQVVPIFAILSQNGVNILGLQTVRQCALAKLLKLIRVVKKRRKRKIGM